MNDDFDITDYEIDPEEFLEGLNRSQKEYLVQILGDIHEKHKYNAISQLFPEDGDTRRELYPKHMGFLSAGKKYRERCFMAGNRVGKSVLGAYEAVCHATGVYPKWWTGKKFHTPCRIWCAGNTNETTRDIIQPVLIGPISDMGSGLIPKKCLFDKNGKAMVTTRSGIPGAKQDIYVKHVSGGLSQITLKSFEQRREGFEGTAQHFIWLDEECPMDIYTECLTRTLTTKGSVILTFTPLKGLSDVVMQFIPNGQFPNTPDRCGEVKKPKEA